MPIPDDRKKLLEALIAYIQAKADQGQTANLQFICTHNARRSQLSEIWCQTAADYYGTPVCCFSGGTEVTAFNKRALASLRRSGFTISGHGGSNPRYRVLHSEGSQPIIAFSKRYDDATNPDGRFAAIMTCSHAEARCPFIPGAERRIALLYDDPKEFDDTPQEALKYDERSLQIASEMLFVFSQIEQRPSSMQDR